MKSTKRMVTLLLILSMLFACAGCGGKDVPQTNSNTNTQQEQTKVDERKTENDNTDVGKSADKNDVDEFGKSDFGEKTDEMAEVDEKDNNAAQSSSNNTPKEEKPLENPDVKETVAFSITGDISVVPDDGVILPVVVVEVSSGDTVYSILERTCKENGISLDTVEYDGTLFINGINGIANFDNGPMSGWVFKVNGIVPNAYAENYQVQPGDIVEWHYACDFSTITT